MLSVVSVSPRRPDPAPGVGRSAGGALARSGARPTLTGAGQVPRTAPGTHSAQPAPTGPSAPRRPAAASRQWQTATSGQSPGAAAGRHSALVFTKRLTAAALLSLFTQICPFFFLFLRCLTLEGFPEVTSRCKIDSGCH